MKKISLILLSVLFIACAGNPPDWWNPSGTYNKENARSKQSQKVNAEPSGSSNVEAEDETPAEQTIDAVLDENYEEINLDPIDEQAEAQKAAAQSLNNTSGQVQVPVQDASSAKTANSLPADGSLPPPSVLE